MSTKELSLTSKRDRERLVNLRDMVQASINSVEGGVKFGDNSEVPPKNSIIEFVLPGYETLHGKRGRIENENTLDLGLPHIELLDNVRIKNRKHLVAPANWFKVVERAERKATKPAEEPNETAAEAQNGDAKPTGGRRGRRQRATA